MPKFDPVFWNARIKQPDWYLDYLKLAEKAKSELGEDSIQLRELNKQIRSFFEGALLEGKVALAAEGPDLDKERQEVETIVIHHTSSKPGYRLDYMQATQLLNVYAPAYANPSAKERGIKGKAIWSGHFRDGRMSFLAYHWLMRMDGSFERLLEDDQIGWHAGNWEVNKKSIAICLDNDYENEDPTDEVLKVLADHIKKYYPGLPIIGHCEARSGTICPGGNFINGWKPLLLEYLK